MEERDNYEEGKVFSLVIPELLFVYSIIFLLIGSRFWLTFRKQPGNWNQSPNQVVRAYDDFHA